MERLIKLFEEQGQSPWLDNLTRGLPHDAASWPSSATGASAASPPTRPSSRRPSRAHRSTTTSSAPWPRDDRPVLDDYWALVLQDIRGALEVFAPLYESARAAATASSASRSPRTWPTTRTGTIASARHLHETIARPNLLVKIPGTAEGVPAIRQMISEGRSINVTLIFSLDRYGEVMEAYLSGLEACEGDLSGVHSVASFFISRVDTEVDRRLDAIGSPEALALKGKAAVAQGKLAYQQFRAAFTGPRWEALRGAGRPAPAAAVGLDVDQEPGLPGHACTSTRSSVRTRSTPCRTPRSRPSPTTARSPAPSTRTSTRPRRSGSALADVGRRHGRRRRAARARGRGSFQKSFDELLDRAADEGRGARRRQLTAGGDPSGPSSERPRRGIRPPRLGRSGAMDAPSARRIHRDRAGRGAAPLPAGSRPGGRPGSRLIGWRPEAPTWSETGRRPVTPITRRFLVAAISDRAR